MHTVFGDMSNKLDRRLLLFRLFRLKKYFWAWLATCVGVLVFTKFREIPRQSPFPSFWSPIKNVLCSSSVHGTPANTFWYIRCSIFSKTSYYTVCNQTLITLTKYMDSHISIHILNMQPDILGETLVITQLDANFSIHIVIERVRIELILTSIISTEIWQ